MSEQSGTKIEKPRVVRVFVSSTFRNMHAEREELVKRIFPQLRKMCEQRGITWGEVDLRWGITDEQKTEGKSGLSRSYGNQALLLANDLDQPHKALPLAEQAYQIAREHGLSRLAERTKQILDSITLGMRQEESVAQKPHFRYDPDLVSDIDADHMLRTAKLLLEKRAVEKALSTIKTFKWSNTKIDNAKAVCHLRLGDAERAIDILSGWLFDSSELMLREDAPLVLKTNYVTALLLQNNIEGAIEYLGQIDHKDHPSVQKLLSVVHRWKKRLSPWQKLLWYVLGIKPQKPVEIDFLPGELMEDSSS